MAILDNLDINIGAHRAVWAFGFATEVFRTVTIQIVPKKGRVLLQSDAVALLPDNLGPVLHDAFLEAFLQ